MNKFTFENKVEPIEVAGKSYTLDTGNVDFLKKAFSKADELKTALTKIDTDNLNDKMIDHLVNTMAEAIDTFLGDGEFERIFNHEECNKSIHYITAVCNFLMVEIKRQSGK